ncbi:MAG TPA: YfhO family protein [Acholeplasmataceae bacterium]|nr:YfhO family protein [Acholeplasmataceae bacterium]
MKKKIYFTYTIIFILFILIGMLPLEIKTKQVFGAGLFTDGLKQHLPFLRDYVQAVKNIFTDGLDIYRYDLGLGSDFFIYYTYYSLFDPLTIIAYIIPIKYIETSYYILIILRLYLSGIFIIMLARKMDIKSFYALISTAFFYTFNITILYSAFRHPMFINGPMLLPLIILGAEKVFRNERPYLLIFASLYGLISQFYFFIYTSFGFELFVILRLLKSKEYSNIKTFFKVNLLYSLGPLLGGFVLLPQLVAITQGSRIASKGFILYSFRNYADIIGSFLIPIVGNYYTSSIGNAFVFFIVILYIFSEKKKSWESLYFIITSILILIPAFGYIINALSYVNNRWSYIINLPAALILGKVVENWDGITKQNITKALKFTFLIFYIALGFLVMSLDFLVLKITFILSVIPVFIFFKLPFKNKPIRKVNYRVLSRVTLVTTFIVLISVSSIYLFLNVSEGIDAYPNISIEDDSFYRVEQNKFVLNTDNLSNDNIIHNFNSTYSYNTMASAEIGKLIEFFNVVNDNNTVGYNGFNSRTILNAINNVKYLIAYESENKKVPYGYEFFDKVDVYKFVSDKFNIENVGYIEYQDGKKVKEEANIYINENFINFGTVYYKYITLKEAEQYSYVDRENILLDAVILDDESEKLEKLEFEEKAKYFKITNFNTYNLEINDNHIFVNDDEGKITFTIDKIENSELYLEIKGIENQNKKESFSIKYKANDYVDDEKNYRYGSNFYIDNPNHLVNMGYYDNEKVSVEITIPKGRYNYKSIGYYLNPMDEVKNKLNSLNNKTLYNLEFNKNGFTGEIILDKSGLLFISLPYSSGFKAFVNGKEVEIIKANIGYMGLELNKGKHKIEFVYETPGMFWGVNISLFSTIILLIIVWNDINRKYKKDYKDAKNNKAC